MADRRFPRRCDTGSHTVAPKQGETHYGCVFRLHIDDTLTAAAAAGLEECWVAVFDDNGRLVRA